MDLVSSVSRAAGQHTGQLAVKLLALLFLCADAFRAGVDTAYETAYGRPPPTAFDDCRDGTCMPYYITTLWMAGTVASLMLTIMYNLVCCCGRRALPRTV